jgi:hypothetical protein
VPHLGTVHSARLHPARYSGSPPPSRRSTNLGNQPRPAKPVVTALGIVVAQKDCCLPLQETALPPVQILPLMLMTFVSQEPVAVHLGTLGGCSGTRGQASAGYIFEKADE